MSRLSAAKRAEAQAAISLPSRVFEPAGAARALVLHLHGGSFRDDASRCSDAVAKLLAEAGAVVVSIDYPTGTMHPFPEALQAAFLALQSLADHRASWADRHAGLFVAGEESGGNLAAALSMMARDQGGPALAGQILISPMLDPRLATASVRCADAGPVGCRWADGWHGYLGTADQASHPYAAPANSSRLMGLPTALVLTAEDDPLRDESLSYGERLRLAGVETEIHVMPAPTGWPCSLDAEPVATCPCAPVALRLFRAFFARTAPSPSSSAHRGPGVSK